jgi:predicted MFS family arabinose efflux permease
MSSAEERTHIVGMVTAGVLTGVVFARLAGGAVTAWLSWRAVYGLSAALLVVSFAFIYRFIPESRSRFEGRYADILRSIWGLFRDYSEIRIAITVSGAAFVLSRMFWATIAFLLATAPFYLNTDLIGLFGLVTLAGAISAPLAGWLNKRFSSDMVIASAMAVLAASFLLLFFFPSAVAFIVAGGILMEGSRQLIQITMQSRTISLVAEARSRLNMLFIAGCFLGAALGAALGLAAWYLDRWDGVCYLAFIVLAIQATTFALTRKKANPC